MSQMPPPSPFPQPPIAPSPKPSSGLAVAGFVLGIVSCVLACLWYVSVPAGIVGLVLSIMGKRATAQSGAATGWPRPGWSSQSDSA